MRIFSLMETKYNQMVSSITTYLSKVLSNAGVAYGNNTVFGQFINVLSAATQNLMLYIEDAMVEQNKYTAQRKKSVYGLAAQSGYTPSLGKAAGVQLCMSYVPSNASNLNVFVNNHEELTCTQNGLVYNLILPQEAIVMSLEKDNSSRYLYAVQGKFESQSFISAGGKFYTQHFNFLGNLDTDYIEVKVNNEKWDYADHLYDMRPDGKQWTYKVSPVGGVDIIFGNDCFGRALKVDDVINITYLVHDGESGNLNPNKETYFVFNNPLQDLSGDEVDGNGIFNVTFATKDSITSGSNSESVQQVRQMIGLNSRSLVMASPDHYKTFINKFSFCGYNRTWSNPGSMVVNSLIIKNYKLGLKDGKDYFSLRESDFKLTDLQKQSIKNCIENSGNQLAGVSYNIIDPDICKYAAYIYIKPKSKSYDVEFLRSKIRTLVGEFFSDVASDVFIPKSDLIQLIKNNIDEVDGVDVYFLSEKNETALQVGHYTNTSYTFDPSTGTYKKSKETVYLYNGENPNLGLDSHGNISLNSDEQFPVLMSGWDFMNNANDKDTTTVIDPLIIVFE